MKKLFVLLIALALIVPMALTGCGENAGDGEEKETVKIAYIGPVTGPSAAFGLGLRNSAQLAVDQANATGELPYNVELLVLDDASDPATAVNSANKAASDPDVVAVIAHFNSGCALATKDVFHKYGLPTVVIAAINDKITQDGYPEINRVITAASLQNVYAGQVAANDFGVNKVAVIHDQTEYGKTNAEQFIEEAEVNGVEMLSFDGIAVGQQDFSALLTKIKSTEPDMVFFGGLATEAALIKRQMDELGINAIFMSDSGIQSKTFIEIAGDSAPGSLCHGLVAPIDELPRGQEFVDAYEAAEFDEFYEAFGPFAYDAAGIVIEAMKNVETVDREALLTGIRNVEYNGILGTTTFDDNGQTELNSIITYVVDDNAWITLNSSQYMIEDAVMTTK